MKTAGLALVLALVGCDRVVCDGDDAAAVVDGLAAADSAYGAWSGSVEVFCLTRARAALSCPSKATDHLEGCAPRPGRAVVVVEGSPGLAGDGGDVCRVMVHERAHWRNPDCGHDDACWPTAAEQLGKDLCP
jgi:hypothetical protein